MNWQKIKDHKWVKKVIQLFRQGLTPRELALSISVGALVGVFPMFGVTTFITMGLAVYLRLNLPLALFITFAMGPLHILLLIPFIRIGEKILSAEHTLLTVSAIREAFRSDYLDALYRLASEVVCGLAGWTLVAIPSTLILFLLLWNIFVLIQRKRKARREPR